MEPAGPGRSCPAPYFRRVVDGPGYRPEQAARGGFSLRRRVVA